MANLLSLTEVQQERQEWCDKADAVLAVCEKEGRDPTEEEISNVETCTKEIDRIDNEVLPRAQKIHDTLTRKVARREGQALEPQLHDLEPKKTRIEALPRHLPVKNFRGERHGWKAEERAYLFGHWALATIGQQIGRYNFPQSNAVLEKYGIQNVAQTNVQKDAGVFVPEQFGMDLILLRDELTVSRQICEVMPMTSDTRTDPKWVSGLTAYFVPEGDAGTESDAEWKNVRLTAQDLMALTRMSAQLEADAAISYGDILVREIGRAFAFKEDDVVFNGTGISTDGGIVGIRTKLQDVDGAGTDSAGLTTQGTGSTWSAIVIGDFHSVIGKCPAYALRSGPEWVTSTTFYSEVMAPLAIAQAGGATIFEAAQTASGGTQIRGSFLGFPVVFSQDFPTATATASVVCTFGSHFDGVRMGDRQQMSVLFSEHASVGGQSVFERNQIAVRGTERIDAVVHGAGDASTAGPIVGLETGT